MESVTGSDQGGPACPQPFINSVAIVPGMDETQILAVLALRELLDDPDRDDWDELVAANRTLIWGGPVPQPHARRNKPART